MIVKSGRAEGIPYSFSRWTDVPAAKWPWFLKALRDGKVIAFDPRDAIPYEWSLKPEDTLGMVFWTKDPKNIVRARDLLAPFKIKVHVTITGWHEVEHGVPDMYEVTNYANMLAHQIGSENVVWRFSPVPLVHDAVLRFRRIADLLNAGGWGQGEPKTTDRVYLSFLQPNDKIPETRERDERLAMMVEMAGIAKDHGIRVMLCNEDRTLFKVAGLPDNLTAGVCAPPEDFEQPGFARPPSEGCGCVLMADPFTINETCTLGCTYCYAADKTLAPKKRNTTRGLPVVRE
jgi:Domain of unknown function (DUF1848)